MWRAILILACCAFAACSPSASKGDAAGANDPAAAPPHYSVKCGAQTFQITLNLDKVDAALADGSTVSLPALFPMSADGVATYTDGKMSFFVKQGAAGAPTISFARGKMAPTACS